jgi:hypothetical protein
MKLQGDKSGRKGHLSVATEVMIALWQTTADALAIFDNFLQYQRFRHNYDNNHNSKPSKIVHIIQPSNSIHHQFCHSSNPIFLEITLNRYDSQT